MFGGFPFGALIVQFLHDFHAECFAFFRGVGNAQHSYAHFIEACVAEGNGAVIIEEQFINGFAFFQTGKSAVLPEDGGYVGNGAQKSFVTAAESPVAKFKTVFKDFPEFIHISFCRAGYVYQIQCDNALVETAVIFMLAVFTKTFRVGGEEAAAAHAGVYVAVFVFLHDFRGNIVGDETFCCAFRSKFRQLIVGGVIMDIIFIKDVDQFRECRCDPYAFFILYSLHSLEKDFFDDHGEIVTGAAFRYFIKIHEHGDERSLAVTGHQSNELVLDCLNTALDLFMETGFNNFGNDFIIHGFAGQLPFFDDFLFDFLTADIDEGRKVRKRKGLAAILVGCYLGNNLGRYVAGGEERMGFFDHCLADDSTVLEHVFQVNEIAVMFFLREIVGIMEVNDAFIVRLDDFFRKKKAAREVFGYLAGHIVALGRIDDRIFIGVFLFYFLVIKFDQRKNTVIGGIALAGNFAFITITDVFLCYFIAAHFHDARFYHILDIFDIGRVGIIGNFLRNIVRNRADLEIVHLMDAGDFMIGFADSVDDFRDIESDFLSVSFDDICADDDVLFISLLHDYTPY